MGYIKIYSIHRLPSNFLCHNNDIKYGILPLKTTVWTVILLVLEVVLTFESYLEFIFSRLSL